LSTSILLLESTRSNGSSFAPYLKRRYDLHVANTGREALHFVKTKKPDLMVLDATSMRTSGDRLCASMRKTGGETPIIHIKGQQSKTEQSLADVLLFMPLTYRKLYNRIERYTPTQTDNILTTGHLQLNLDKNLLIMADEQKKLTPKVTKLLEVLMRNEGELVERRHLINHVWQTDYMGDTRTLDVHIRWVRKAIEPKPSKPQYIKTIRGKGYIFTSG